MSSFPNLIISMSGQAVPLNKWLEAFGVSFAADARDASTKAFSEAIDGDFAYDMVLKPTRAADPCETDPNAFQPLYPQVLQSDVRLHGLRCSTQ